MASTIAAATTTAAAATAGGTASAAGFGADFNTFLTMLTTQLQNQDPTNAMDPNQMTQQLVQFAGVEQQIRMNSSLEKLIGLQQAAQLTASAPLLGRQVEVEGDSLALQGGTARLRLPQAGLAAAARIQVLDLAGRTLREDRVALGSAATEWSWNGKDAGGKALPDGGYRFVVQGVAADGSAVPLSATTLGTVTGAERRDGELQLMFGSFAVGFDKVRSLRGG